MTKEPNSKYTFLLHFLTTLNLFYIAHLVSYLRSLDSSASAAVDAINVTHASNRSVLFLTRVPKAGSTSVHGWLQVGQSFKVDLSLCSNDYSACVCSSSEFFYRILHICPEIFGNYYLSVIGTVNQLNQSVH